MICKCSLKVRTYECDSYGHVNNANYLNYLEFARYEFLKSIGYDYESMLKDGYSFYIARIEINYKKPAFTDDDLEIRSRSIKKGAVSGTLSQEVWRGDDLIVGAEVTWAFVDANGLPAKIPPKYDLPGMKPDKNDTQ